MEQPAPFISRVRLKNFKSIAGCDVRLGPLTLLVGPNGSGKSNFLQALTLLGRAVSTTPYEAVSALGGLPEIVRRAPEPAESFSIDVEATFPRAGTREHRVSARYGFEIGTAPRQTLRPFEVLRETCEVRFGSDAWRFSVERGRVQEEGRVPPAGQIEPDRLYLPVAATQRTYSPLALGLASMQSYNLTLEALREPAPLLEGAVLDPCGNHLGDVLSALTLARPELKRRIDAYLSAIAAGIEGVDPYVAGHYMTVAFRAQAGREAESIEFGPESISDGTIRAAGILAALFQLPAADGRISLIGIEEPEIALHPAAAGVLFDALTEASEQVQLVVTTQSPDLLDRDDLDMSAVRAVSVEDGVTRIGEVDRASRQIVADKLYTLGELMRGNQISPEPEA
ncbi:MAG TPA: AAA family ATPase [Streptosporangiaceae bacterium]|jgi:predicted ATPase